MVLLKTPEPDFEFIAPDFNLKSVDGNFYSLQHLKGDNGTVVVFMCNHCPYVMAILNKIIRESRDLAKIGVNMIAINPNNNKDYPQDSYENMQKLANEKKFPFQYLFDEKQIVAKEYGAVCTPDFFGFNKNLHLRYRGRLDSSGMTVGLNDLQRELFEAMQDIIKEDKVSKRQNPSIGCSIKWK